MTEPLLRLRGVVKHFPVTKGLFARQVGAALENVQHHRAAAEHAARLAELQAELVARERLAAVGEAAAVVAHEIRNPVAAILNAISLLKRDRSGTTSRPIIQMLEEESRRLEHLVRDLLNYSGPLRPHLRPLNLGEVARRAVRLLESRDELRGVTLEVFEHGGPSTVEADPDLLELALLNLAQNALHASPPGGSVQIQAVSGPDGSRKLIVDDQGPGISAPDAARIFEPFFTTRARGSGLGLAVVSRVVEAHDAQLTLSASPSGGARFEIRFGSGEKRTDEPQVASQLKVPGRQRAG